LYRLEVLPSFGTGGALLQANSKSLAHHMKKKSVDLPEVPVGIVVSVGKESSQAPRFSAYIWGPAPENKTETIKAA
jgi:hypothetical protein